MSCYHPLKRFILPSGDGKVVSSSCNCLIRDGSKWIGSVLDLSPSADVITEFQYIPCGQCIGCRLDYSRTWASRMCLEASSHEHNWFVTLTYDDEHLPPPVGGYVDSSTGEYVDNCFSSLSKRDVQLFVKRLRKNTGQQIRYYLAGEYGDQSFRPHYHLILFGLDLDDLQLQKRSSLGFCYYVSDIIRKAWPFGNHVVCDFCWETAAYTARYVVKKLKGRDVTFYNDFAIEPPFVLMSLKPGIGRDYYDRNKDYIYRFGGFYLDNCPGIKIKPPRYFDRLFDLEEPETMEEVKRRRKIISDRNMRDISRFTDLSYYDYLAARERELMKKTKALSRKEC